MGVLGGVGGTFGRGSLGGEAGEANTCLAWLAPPRAWSVTMLYFVYFVKLPNASYRRLVWTVGFPAPRRAG